MEISEISITMKNHRKTELGSTLVPLRFQYRFHFKPSVFNVGSSGSSINHKNIIKIISTYVLRVLHIYIESLRFLVEPLEPSPQTVANSGFTDSA